MEKILNEYVCDETHVSNGHYIVAVGASAGGLEAIHEFFDNMPQNTNLSFIIIQHLSPDHKSLLVELISKHTHMRVFEAEDNMFVQKECVYVIPHKKLMTIYNGKLHLVEKSHEKLPNTAIDHFLLTLAAEKKDKAIAVILSGTGSDGTKGIEAIKGAGGIAIVQDPATARFDGMPNSAIVSGNADLILPPEMMPEEIFNHINESPIHVLNKGKIDGALLDEIFSIIYQAHGYDFHYYKTPTIIRRLSKRMALRNVQALPDYISIIRQNPEEVKSLSKDFLIGVTRFFRDQQAFDCLEMQVLPALVNEKENGEILKVWVCACSTGEEAYSLAILIDQYLEKHKRSLDVKIFATDIDESSIDFAARNQYPFSIEKDVRPDILGKYFVKESKGYAVIPRIRKQLVFARHNVIKDPPFIKNDLVTCRNMLIYMNSVLQQKVLSALHFSANINGYLFLGNSESVAPIKDVVEEINSKWKLYRKIAKNPFTPNDMYRKLGSNTSLSKVRGEILKSGKIENSLQSDFTEAITNDFGYVCFYIDSNYEIKESIGHFSRFLSLPEKRLNLNILKMVPMELSVPLNTAIRNCWKEGQKVFLKSVRVKQEQGDLFLSVSVRPPQPLDGRPYTLVVLGENSLSQIHVTPEIKESHAIGISSDYLLELETELNETRSSLQMAVEGLETTNEELQSSNEELLSANEELQSSNEELQSLNEELHTLNTEHQLKIKELIELNDDLNNYFRSSDVGQIFLDKDLRIRKFNSAAVNMVNLIDGDIGRPISHISTNIRYENLFPDIARVSENEDVIEKEILLNNESRCLMRIMPYIRRDKKQDGVIITFVDISAIAAKLKEAEAQRGQSENRFRKVFESNMVGMLFTDKDGTIINANDAFLNMSGYSREELLHGDITWDKITPPEYAHLNKEAAEKIRIDGICPPFENVCQRKDGHYINVLLGAASLNEADAVAVTYVIDISEKKEAERKELELQKIISKQQDEFLRILMHAPALISIRRGEGLRVEFINETARQYFGGDNVEGKSNEDLAFDYHWDNSRAIEIIKQVYKTGQQHVAKAFHIRRAGDEQLAAGDFWFDFIFQPVFDINGKVDGVASFAFDVSDIIRANKEIKLSESRFRFLAEAMPQKVWTARPNGEGDYFNQSWLDYTGLSLEELRGWGWLRVVHPDDIEENKKLWMYSIENGVDFEMERRLLKADGKYYWHLSRSVPQKDEHGDIMMWVGTSTDIHEQKTESEALKVSEDYFRQLADQSPFMIWKVDSEGLCNYVNKQWITFTGLSFEKSIGLGWSGAFHPDDREKEYQKFIKAFSKREIYHSKFRIKRSKGEYHWVLAQANPIKSSGFEGYIGSLTDITEQELAQQATRLLMQKKDEFMSIASHELKTPITSMKASLQIAERLSNKKVEVEKIQSFIEKANKQVNKLTSLVEDLLDVTKIQAGKLQFEVSRFNIVDALNDCIDQVHNENFKHRIIITSESVIEVEADKHRLEQVIVNFLSNAIKYSPDANKVVLNVIKGNGFVKVTVTDFGIGIPEDKINFVFDRFFRVQESSQKFSGLGLGLFISAEIIKRHNGEVGVISEEGKGSTFWFTLPMQ